MPEQEEWRPVPGFHDYQVSSLGQVASIKRGGRQILAGGKTDTGYRNVLLYRNGKRVGGRVHALVALTFLGPRPDGLEIRHLDGDRTNNALANLAYGTHAQNMQDRKDHGWFQSDESNCPHSADLDDSRVYVFPGETKRYCPPCKASKERGRRRARRTEGEVAA
jgi:hypothetical protein